MAKLIVRQPNGLFTKYDHANDCYTCNCTEADVIREGFDVSKADAHIYSDAQLDPIPPGKTPWDVLVEYVMLRRPAEARAMVNMGTTPVRGVHPPFPPGDRSEELLTLQRHVIRVAALARFRGHGDIAGELEECMWKYRIT